MALKLLQFLGAHGLHQRGSPYIFRSEKSFIIWETRLIVYLKEKMSLLVLCLSPLFKSHCLRKPGRVKRWGSADFFEINTN